ncbi:hypothetical protein [Bosea robiniae]|uniref:Uncharacterized protein n=1 Tax=Bosea robiniae TaxID=1036780 RepID=A0ABY0PA06_9HYPH|nr:hypothetical protein [Bosea robiniae]SDH20286.1 hypothetical protein SAMN05421844_107148 [Bosea robiniae]
MGDVVRLFKTPVPKTISRHDYIESILALGRDAGPKMTPRQVVEAAREGAWREAHNVVQGCADLTWEPDEREALGVVSTIDDEGVLADLRKLASVVVACDMMLDSWPAEPETTPCAR